MNILIACEWDNGGQMYTLYRALNEFTDHTARLITYKTTYLHYGTDIVDPTLNQVKELVEWADFYILGELLDTGFTRKLIGEAITHTNCIVRAGGSLARARPDLYMTGVYKNIMKTGAYHDWSLSFQISPMGSTVNMYYFNEFPIVKRPESPIKLHYSGTKAKRKAAHIMQAAWDKLDKHYKGTGIIEFVSVADMSWQEALRIKGECHIHYDHAMALGAYANNAIEGMYYGMPVFCAASGWCRSIYPDIPIINVTNSDEIVQATIMLIENRTIMDQIGKDGREYVIRTHDVQNAIHRWVYLIDFVSSHYTYAIDYPRRDVVFMNVDIFESDGKDKGSYKRFAHKHLGDK